MVVVVVKGGQMSAGTDAGQGGLVATLVAAPGVAITTRKQADYAGYGIQQC
jgi:hypothetical protein